MAWLSKLFGAILINPTKPKMVILAFRQAREALNNGELVCIFPEGGMTRSGQVQAFKPGMMTSKVMMRGRSLRANWRPSSPVDATAAQKLMANQA